MDVLTAMLVLEFIMPVPAIVCAYLFYDCILCGSMSKYVCHFPADKLSNLECYTGETRTASTLIPLFVGRR